MYYGLTALPECDLVEIDGGTPQPGVNCQGYEEYGQWDWCINLDPAIALPGVNCVTDPIEEPYVPEDDETTPVTKRPYGPALPPKPPQKELVKGIPNNYLYIGAGVLAFAMFMRYR